MIVVIFEPSLGALSGESPSDLRDAIRNRREVHHTEERSDIVVLQYWQGSYRREEHLYHDHRNYPLNQ